MTLSRVIFFLNCTPKPILAKKKKKLNTNKVKPGNKYISNIYITNTKLDKN